MHVYVIDSNTGTIRVDDYKGLMSVWGEMRGQFMTMMLVRRIVVEKPLTESQYNRLAADLKDKVIQSDSRTWLERLAALEDPRGEDDDDED
jgi:hypothetical protein